MDMLQIGEFAFHVILLSTMLIGVIGVVTGLFPGHVIIWLAMLVYGIVVGFDVTGGVLFGIITGIMLAALVVDNFIMGYAARERGASWLAIAVAMIAGVLGTFIIPPFGGIILALLGLFIVEVIRLRNVRHALDSTRNMALGCGWSVIVRLVMAFMMIGLWLLWALHVI
jgi:uncharacterized protein YqgC (DUF456 family)